MSQTSEEIRTPESIAAMPQSLGHERDVETRPERPTRPPYLRILRRRLLLASAPVVLLALLAAVRLLTLNVFASRTIDAYQSGDKVATMETAQRQGWVNLVEQWRYPFAVGNAHIVAEHPDLARDWFEEALARVPKGERDECLVRVNLGLTYEALGDMAAAREHPDQAKQFYEKGIETTSVAPDACDKPDQKDRNQKKELKDTRDRLQGKSGNLPPVDPNRPEPPNQPSPSPSNPPSQQKQNDLEKRRQESQRNRENGKQDNEIPTMPPNQNPKPW